ncbi:SigB/SigF/SigG family RNA polymerase sigma factor [Streptomyces sp. NPDC007084]|uniref:SigB/SigF/SigG family RNA polymerase sigma factor n=1 Tax=Streptomyces sp. NPDC007084 TaxID=3154313 RepID=UPI0034529FA1
MRTTSTHITSTSATTSHIPATRATSAHTANAPKRHPHHDAPDTDAAFERLAELGDGPERRALRDEIVKAWMPMAERIAGRYRGRGEALEDLTQVAALGLVKAVDRYSPGRGHAFESYAVPTIAGEIKRHFRDHMWVLHVPRRVQEARNRVRTAIKELTSVNAGRQPTVAEIAAYARLTEEEVRNGLEALDSYAALSLDAELNDGDDGYSLADGLGETDAGFDLVVDREAVRPAMRRLPEREQTILYLRFFRGMTQSCIAEELGVSQMHVSRLISSSCAALREQVMSDAA